MHIGRQPDHQTPDTPQKAWAYRPVDQASWEDLAWRGDTLDKAYGTHERQATRMEPDSKLHLTYFSKGEVSRIRKKSSPRQRAELLKQAFGKFTLPEVAVEVSHAEIAGRSNIHHHAGLVLMLKDDEAKQTLVCERLQVIQNIRKKNYQDRKSVV